MRQIKTNAIAISKAFSALGAVNYMTVPIPEIESKENYEMIASTLVIVLGNIPEAFNMFFSAILGSEENYAEEMDAKEATEVVVNFYKSIGDAYKESIVKLLTEGREQRALATKKHQAMIGDLLEKAIGRMPSIEKLMP